MVTELADRHFCDQAGPGDAARTRPSWNRGRTHAVFAATASIFRPNMDVSFQDRRLQFEFVCDVLADLLHRAATTRAHFLFIVQVVIVDDFPEFIPIDLAFPPTAMALDICFALLVRCGGLFQVVGHREVQLDQMALPLAFGEPLLKADGIASGREEESWHHP